MGEVLVPSPGSAGGGAVDSVNGQTGVVTLTAADVGATESVNGQTGVVTLTASDVGAADTNDARFLRQRPITWVLNGGGSALTAGEKVTSDVQIPYAGIIQRWSVMAPNEAGSIVVDIWKDVWANWPPTVADTITGTDKPTLAVARKAESVALTGWNLAIATGDILRLNVDSVATVTFVIVQLWVVPT